MWELDLNNKTFPGIPKEPAYIILRLNSVLIAVIGPLFKCWVTLVGWMTFLVNSEVDNSFYFPGR